MPEGLLLGHSTVADIVNALGHPDEITSTWTAADIDYHLIFYPDFEGQPTIVLTGLNPDVQRGGNPDTRLTDSVCEDRPYNVEVVEPGRQSPHSLGFDASPEGPLCGVPVGEGQGEE